MKANYLHDKCQMAKGGLDMRRRSGNGKAILIVAVVAVVILAIILLLILPGEEAKAPNSQNTGTQAGTQVGTNDNDETDENEGSNENEGTGENEGSDENEGTGENEGSGENEGTGENGGSADTEANGINEKIAALAIEQIGKGYEWGAEGPVNFDASGLIYYCFVENGISIPRTIKDQSTHGTEVSKEDIQPGDVVFFWNDTPGTAQFVGLYVGDGTIIVVRSTTCLVGELPMASDYFNERLVCIRRFW